VGRGRAVQQAGAELGGESGGVGCPSLVGPCYRARSARWWSLLTRSKRCPAGLLLLLEPEPTIWRAGAYGYQIKTTMSLWISRQRARRISAGQQVHRPAGEGEPCGSRG